MDTSTLFTVWDQAGGQAPVQRALCLLAAGWPERSWAQWAATSIGERDEYLLRLREQLFGQQLQGVASCPQCAEKLELTFETRDIRAPGPSAELPLLIETQGYALRCRPPNSEDLLIAMQASQDRQRHELMQRCVVSASLAGDPVPPQQLPEEVIATLSSRLAQLDPQAVVELSLDCPACAHCWVTAFDILSYLWGEIEDWGQRLLCDIHALALAYGWSERDILAMSPRRRRLYLDLIGA
ncbi:phage baseplate protein [Chitinimonas arctica]|uniref:Phage baseplate protein n=1 Tax=Chitinimonas arctica TaxID=2594795 RepID=A0A516SLG7_9NEIS|nr:phage baseplate protein [Chitinimonas arctica]QDQ29007.1 phage baseplate protein [Chitinimonas arctica]